MHSEKIVSSYINLHLIGVIKMDDMNKPSVMDELRLIQLNQMAIMSALIELMLLDSSRQKLFKQIDITKERLIK